MKKVAVVFGSRSVEHDVSIVTALTSVIEPLRLSGEYEPVPVYISKDGAWYSDNKLANIEFYTTGDLPTKLSKLKKVNLKFENGLWLIKPGLGAQKIRIDVVFPATHGTFGEDGSLMGLLEMADVPYVGYGLPASVIAMDKVLSKRIATDAGVETNNWRWLSRDEFNKDQKTAINKLSELKFPIFVKQAHLGSSIGVARVKDSKELINALEVAFHYDDKAIIEEEVQNLAEVTVPVMGNDNLQVAMVEESLNKDAEFFDFDTKYMQGGKKGKNGAKISDNYSRIPADISKELYKKSEETAKAVYKAVEGTGTARIDLLIDKKAKKVYFNEINPMPGSLYQHNWSKAGVSNVELVKKLVELAVERAEKRKKQGTVFNTNYLQQF